MKKTPQALKNRVTEITLHSGCSEDFNFEWEELVFTYFDATEELVSRISTSSDCPEDNSLGRIGSHDLLRIMQAVEINPKCTYRQQYHENSYGYLKP